MDDDNISEDDIMDAIFGASDVPAELKEGLLTGKIQMKMGATHHTDDLENEIREVLDALEINAAFVSDAATINMFIDSETADQDLEQAEQTLGITVNKDEYLYQTAQRLRDSRG